MPAPRPELPGVSQAGRLVWQPNPSRIRGRLGDIDIVDSPDAILLWERAASSPHYVFPQRDIGNGRLEPSKAGPEHDGRGRSRYLDLIVDGDLIRHAAWEYEVEALDGFVCFSWDALDTWFEENEALIGHARDPYHRIDIRESSRHVRISLDGTVLAETEHPLLVFETGLPTRYYMPREDVTADLLGSDTTTACPYKGVASYWSVDLAGTTIENLIWSYPDPLAESSRIGGLLAFFDERIDVEVDGEKQVRPKTVWS